MGLTECAKYQKRKIYGVFNQYHVICHNLSFEDCLSVIMNHKELDNPLIIYDSLTLHGWVFKNNSNNDTIKLGELNIVPLLQGILPIFVKN